MELDLPMKRPSPHATQLICVLVCVLMCILICVLICVQEIVIQLDTQPATERGLCVHLAACSPTKLKEESVAMKQQSRENLVKSGSRRGSVSSDTAEKTPTQH